ncbi:hypothetical protein EHP00_1595 [Ecytonucleospora hepatopenaei]|uniref:Uncharacterized protein n=1 Tax=Ecytonucleospora hepatopenaei TaxID=646526 RepID=A0A1W0E8Y3_9MICR|nr:hypothetical protein EHP00_1595 [Ecytonucleospora hepatopenaei]
MFKTIIYFLLYTTEILSVEIKTTEDFEFFEEYTIKNVTDLNKQDLKDKKSGFYKMIQSIDNDNNIEAFSVFDFMINEEKHSFLVTKEFKLKNNSKLKNKAGSYKYCTLNNEEDDFTNDNFSFTSESVKYKVMDDKYNEKYNLFFVRKRNVPKEINTKNEFIYDYYFDYGIINSSDSSENSTEKNRVCNSDVKIINPLYKAYADSLNNFNIYREHNVFKVGKQNKSDVVVVNEINLKKETGYGGYNKITYDMRNKGEMSNLRECYDTKLTMIIFMDFKKFISFINQKDDSVIKFKVKCKLEANEGKKIYFSDRFQKNLVNDIEENFNNC